MGYNQNDPSYQTKNSRVLAFSDFNNNIRKEHDELEKLNRNAVKKDGEANRIPNNTTKKYNKVTHKIDDLSKEEIEDKLQALEDLGIKDSKHKYKATIPTQQSSNESVMSASEFLKRK